jgi:hypothetical protein
MNIHIIMLTYISKKKNFILKLNSNIYMHKNICIIHNHDSSIEIEFTCNLMLNEILLQFKANIKISGV